MCRRRKTVPRLFAHTSPVNSTSETADVSELTRVESAIEREKIRCERVCVRGPRPFPNPFLATGAPGSGTSATHAGAHARDGVPNRVLPSPTRENARRVAERALGSHTPAVHIYVPALGESPSRRLSRFSRRRRVCFPRDERARGGPQGIRPVQGGDDQVRVLRSSQARRPEGADGTSARPFPARASLPPRATPPPNSRSVALRRGVEFSSLPVPSFARQVTEIVHHIRDGGLAKLGGATPANTIVGQLSKGTRAFLLPSQRSPREKECVHPSRTDRAWLTYYSYPTSRLRRRRQLLARV